MTFKFLHKILKTNKLFQIITSITLLAAGSPVRAQSKETALASASIAPAALVPGQLASQRATSNATASSVVALASQLDKPKPNTWPHASPGDWNYPNSSDEISIKPISPQPLNSTTAGREAPATYYAQLTAVLLNALKEQQQQIETLKKQAVVLSQRAAESEIYTLQRIARVEAANAILEQRLHLLEARDMQASSGR